MQVHLKDLQKLNSTHDRNVGERKVDIVYCEQPAASGRGGGLRIGGRLFTVTPHQLIITKSKLNDLRGWGNKIIFLCVS